MTAYIVEIRNRHTGKLTDISERIIDFQEAARWAEANCNEEKTAYIKPWRTKK